MIKLRVVPNGLDGEADSQEAAHQYAERLYMPPGFRATQLDCVLCADRLGEEPIGDILYFDYGCIAFWGLTQKQEQVRRTAARARWQSCCQ